jgi:hypothetical protein
MKTWCNIGGQKLKTKREKRCRNFSAFKNFPLRIDFLGATVEAWLAKKKKHF